MKYTQHVAYLIVGEDINNPLLRRQVLELLCEIKHQQPDLQITLLNFLAFHTILNHKEDLRRAREILEVSGIKLRVIPSFVPWPIPHLKFHKTDVGYRPYTIWTKSAARWLGFVMWPVMTYYYIFHKVRVFHCRSYPPAYAAIFFKKIFSETKVIFDPRSDFPEENVTAGNWGVGSKEFIFWKNAERKMLKESDLVACIAPSFVRFYKAIAPEAKCFLVPNNVDINKFRRNDEKRLTVRKELNISEGEIVICYLGTLGLTGWNRIATYVDLIKSLGPQGTKFHFLFIVPNYSKINLDAELLGSVLSSRVTTINVPDADVPKYLWASDYGIQLHPNLTIRTGTKIGEYLAAGLPVIVNRNAIGAVELVNEWQVGVVINGERGGVLDSQDKELLCSLKSGLELARWSADVSELAKVYFDNSIIAARYNEKYSFDSGKISL